MLKISASLLLNETELNFSFIRSPGPGGQHVNKTATAVCLRFNILASCSLPEKVRARLLVLLRKKITSKGELIVKASRYRTQERNKQDAIDRLAEWIRRAAIEPKKRKSTKPTSASKERRLTTKKLHAKSKFLRRRKVDADA
jgi:ribosome-associated protein